MDALYKWRLDWDDSYSYVNPIYKDDLAIEYQQEQGQMFFRGKLSGKVQFVGKEANYIINAPFYTEFYLYLLKSNNNGVSFQIYHTFKFFKTDCTINEDDESVSVQPSVLDQYNDILNGLEKEFNLLDMPLAVQPLSARKRPMVQIYTEGEEIVTCITDGNYFETDRINDDVTPGDCHFARSYENWRLHFTNTQEVGLQSDFYGVFRGVSQSQPYDSFYNNQSYYYIQYFEYYEYDEYGSYHNGLRIIRFSDNATVWEFKQSDDHYRDIPDNITFRNVSDQSQTITAEKSIKYIYVRLVCDLPQVVSQGGETLDTYKIGSSDIVNNNRNLRYCIGIVVPNLIQSDRLSDEPTKWGRNDNGKYYLPPSDNLPYIPVSRSQWGITSIWVNLSVFLDYIFENASKVYTIKDTYPLAAVINALLSKVAPDIHFYENSTSSKFFYDDTISSGVAAYLNDSRPFISPKSNILLGEYQEPAQKAPCTLKTIFDMIAKVYGCYWYVTANKTLVIEHISWFKRGGSYSSSAVVGYDLTQLVNLPNDKKWAFATSQYQFDKINMPARYQYEWMDEVSEAFKGKPINILSKFVQEDKVEEVTIANFSSDLDLMLLAPEKFSKDGFALLQANLLSIGVYAVPVTSYSQGVYTYRIQNWKMAMKFLQPYFLTYDMPSWNIQVNDVATTAAGIQRAKKQTISFPVGINDPDINKLVKTYLGNGQFDKLSINLSSRMAKATIKYQTYSLI